MALFTSLGIFLSSSLLATTLVVSPVIAACSLSRGSVYQYWVDGIIHNATNISGTKANLGAFNPDPVFSKLVEGGTSFWVMITNNVTPDTGDRVAQIGWIKAGDSGFNSPYVFLQAWSDSGSLLTLFPNCLTNTWGTYLLYAYTCKADNNYDYLVEKDLSTDVFTFKWGAFPAYHLGYRWDPNQSAVAGEIHNHGNTTKSGLGDHYLGAIGHVVQATSPKVRVGSGSYSSVNFTVWNPHTGVASVAKFGSPTTSFVQFHDPRCTS
jgi:hypothetical protein